MLKIFAIDFVRQALEQTMFEEHLKDINLYGGKDQVSILSFYEQLKSQDEVNRFVETYRDLSDQQNRTGLILNGVLVSPENPTITNLYSCLIVPLTWSLSFRCNIANRDDAIVSINNLTTQLKGKKVDIAQLECEDEKGGKCYKPFKVGTIGQNQGQPALKNGDYIGETSNADLTQGVTTLLNSLYAKGVKSLEDEEIKELYVGKDNKIIPIKVTKHEEIIGDEVNFNITDTDGITDINYDDFGNNQTSVNGTIRIGSDELTEIPDYITLTINFEVSDNNHIERATVQLTVPKANMSIEDDVLWFNNDFSFILNTSEWNFETINVIIDDEQNCVAYYNTTTTQYTVEVLEEDSVANIEIPPEHTSFEKYKLSMSFDAIRCDEPRNLNGNEYCELTFSGSATLVNESVALGNDLLKVAISKIGVEAQTPVTFTNPPTYYLEPMEMPSGSNANTKLNQLVSNKFKNNSHTDALSLTLQYSFICDMSIDIIKQWYAYARYGQVSIALDGICPNLKYNTKEIVCSWGNYEQHEVITKIVESIDIENSESDVLTIGLTMQIQGENN